MPARHHIYQRGLGDSNRPHSHQSQEERVPAFPNRQPHPVLSLLQIDLTGFGTRSLTSGRVPKAPQALIVTCGLWRETITSLGWKIMAW